MNWIQILLIAAVAIGSGVVFTGATLMRSIDDSMAVGFTRLGADMMVVPEGALTNITAALLTVEPTDLVLEADVLAKARLASVARAAPQKIARRTVAKYREMLGILSSAKRKKLY